MPTLITGGTGHLGSYLARFIAENDADDLVVFDRYPTPGRLENTRSRVTLIRGDVLEPQELLATMTQHKIDRVAHFAFTVGKEIPEKFLPNLRLQCMGTANVYEAARLAGIRRIVNASSVGVYGLVDGSDDGPTVTEDEPLHPHGIYSASKLWGEIVGRAYNAEHGMEIVHMRACAAFGDGRLNRASIAAGFTEQRYDVMVNLELAALGEPVEMPPDEQRWDFLYAADCAQAWWLALTAEDLKHDVFNLSGEQRPAGDMTRHIRRLVPEAQLTVASERKAAVPVLMDNRRIIDELGFKPTYTLESGMEDYLNRIRERGRDA